MLSDIGLPGFILLALLALLLFAQQTPGIGAFRGKSAARGQKGNERNIRGFEACAAKSSRTAENGGAGSGCDPA